MNVCNQALLELNMTGDSSDFDNSLVEQSLFCRAIVYYIDFKQLDENMHITLQGSYCMHTLIYVVAVVKYSSKPGDE